MAPAKREERRRIPLTAFALLTVPEDPMLSVYLRNKEAIDISMERRMCGANLSGLPSSGTPSDSAKGRPQLHHVDDSLIDKEKLAGKLQASRMELELDKFMANLTATESPNAVVKTIASTRGIQFQETGQRKN